VSATERALVSRGVKVVGFDDGPFRRESRGDVLVVGAIYRGGDFLDGMVTTRVRRDGRNATERLVGALVGSRYFPQLHYVMLDGIAFGGFNVVDLARLHGETGLPLLVVVRRRPGMEAVREALLRLPGGRAKWRLVEAAGPAEPCRGLWVQRVGLDRDEAEALLDVTCTRAKLPEPLRAAHIVAGALVTGEGGRRP
jgi:endonuclease V-like protein UPF0215 family